jgi:hypothetical protein
MSKSLEYPIPPASATPSLKGKWKEPAWRDVPVARISHFHRRSSRHHPRVEAKLTYTPKALHVFFRVRDRYVRCIRTKYQASVCQDSCVEFFVQPKPGKGYFNFEINCGGTMLLYYIENAGRTEKGFIKSRPVPWKVAGNITVFHSLPRVVDPEISGPREWTLEYRIPLRLFETYVGSLGILAGQVWKGNLYKCADDTSHPHWASWAPIGAELNFHVPKYFRPLRFQ